VTVGWAERSEAHADDGAESQTWARRFAPKFTLRSLQIDAPSEDGIEGGGLIIDYSRPESRVTERLVFGFNESGMWVEFDSGSSNQR
jgi:hypothetical protein